MLSGNPPGGGGHRPALITTPAPATPQPATEQAAQPGVLTGASASGSPQQVEALVELMEALDAMARDSGYPLAPEDIAELAANLVDGVTGEVLDLSQFDRDDANSSGQGAGELPPTPVGLFSPEIWRALDAAALALGNVPIRHVVLPAGMRPREMARAASTGLSQLPQLRGVTVRVAPHATQVDLRPLAALAKEGQPLAVQVDAPGDTLQEVLSARLLRERAAKDPARSIHGRKCVVVYPPEKPDRKADGPADGKAHKARPLSSHFYQRRATGMEAAARAAGLDMEGFARALNLNGQGHLTLETKEGKSASPGPAQDMRIVCRHLCLLWLAIRAEARARKGTQEAKRFSYAPLATVESIEKQASASTEREFMQLLAAPPVAVMMADDFGQVLARQLEAMEAGETRLFSLLTADHALTVDLQRLRRDHGGELRDSFIIDVYDPNRTVDHVRASLGSLEEVREAGLARWLQPQLMAEYFTTGELAVISLYAYASVKGSTVTRHEATASPGEFRVPVKEVAHADYLYWSLMAGDAERVRASITAMLATPGLKGMELYKRLTTHGGLGWAMDTGRTAAVQAYVAEVLAAPARRLPSEDRFDLLLGLYDNVPAVHGAVAQGHVETARAWLHAILASPLHASQRAVLALACDGRDIPMARLLCEQPPAPGEAARPPQHAFLHAYVGEVLAAPGFDGEVLQAMLAAEDPGQAAPTDTAAQRAIAAGNPLAAGAMVCAVLESGLPAARREQALEALGVDIDEVLKVMTAGGATGAPWAARIAAARQAPPPDAKAIVTTTRPVSGADGTTPRAQDGPASPPKEAG